MSGQTILGLVLVALFWVAVWFAARAPRKPFFDQFRESPMFQPKGSAAAALIATVAAAFAAFLYFAGRL